ncbi:MAG: hypothetical protein MJ252_10080 [archaeon]|nr:hypothetical protein [archaeon]
MKFKNRKIFLYFLVLLISFINCDLPVHCVKSQIVGKWTFQGEHPKLKETIKDKYLNTCLHKIPSHESTSYLTYTNRFQLNLTEENFNVNFNEDNTCEIEKEGKIFKGKWTMIYNEGFEFKFNNGDNLETYFFFSRYDRKGTPGNGEWMSYCYSTLIGWQNILTKEGKNYQGCFIGNKKIKNNDMPTNEFPGNQIMYVEPPELISKKSSKEFHRFTQLTLTNQADTSLREYMSLTFLNKDQSKLVNQINNNNFGWIANNYEKLKGKTINEVNEMIKSKRMYLGNDYTTFEIEDIVRDLKITEPSDGSHLKNIKNKDNIILPKEFNWLNYVSNPKEQGACGSCYGVALVGSLEARFRIKYWNILKKYSKYFGNNLQNFSLSIKHLLKCSVFNQGCDGGYAFLAGKFFKEYELFLDQCFDESKDCLSQNYLCPKYPELSKLKLGVSDYYYVGGAYMKSNEENIMKDLYLNGPLAISFEPDSTFSTYSKGVFTGNKFQIKDLIIKEKEDKIQKEWERVDHSVLLVGWGEEEIEGNTVKYWVIQNSWGNKWGVHGFAKFLRGIDLDGIESIGEAAIPTLIEEE